jgi:hypothetical protein
MKRSAVVSMVLFGIVGCSASGPGEDAIKSALAERTDQKGCATSVLFKQFPIKESYVRSNGNILAALSDAGLVKTSGNTYVLTDLGQSTYDPDAPGFCYTHKYLISDITIVKTEPQSELPSALSGAWYVSFNVSPDDVAEWVKNEKLIKAASRASIEDLTAAKNYTVRLAQKKGDDELIIADPRFSFRPGIHFNMGW